MFNSIRLVALMAFAAVTTAAAASPYDLNTTRFERAGYKVDARYDADRSMQLTGRNVATRSHFRLKVTADNHVTGIWDGQRIDTFVDTSARTMTASIAGR